MKLHRLELEGFGPFRTRQVVDFDAFDDDGIFLISGRTGSGKSSILDGVCFALYGGVPRYDGAEKRIRSDYCAPGEPTQVRLEFEVGGARWRVTRAPEYDRPKARGEGLTTVPHAAELEEQADGTWIARAAKPRDVALLLDDILGLNQQQFLQVILLAQNRFAQFLLAKNDDRQALLRTLFGSRTYGAYQDAFEDRRRAAAEQVAGGDATVRAVLDEADRLIAQHELSGGETDAGGEAPTGDDDVSRAVDAVAASVDERLAAAEVALQRADYRREGLERARAEADAAYAAAVAAHTERAAVHEKLGKREASRAALAALDADAPTIAAQRSRVAEAATAELLRDPIERAERAAAGAVAATERAAAALTAWTAVGGEADTLDALDERIDEMTGELARWEAAAAQERDLVAAEAQAASAQQSVQDLIAQLDGIDARLADLRAQRTGIDDEAPRHAARAAGLEVARAALTSAQGRLAAARDAETLAVARTEAEAAHATASTELERATASVTGLLQRRLAGHAGELAAELVDGDPCPVCGSTAHPHPAAADGEPVTDGAMDAAVAAKDAAVDAERAAAERARSARDAHAAATARAGGAGVDELAAEVATAEADAAAAAEAAEQHARLVTERATVDATEAAVTTERAALTDDLTAARRVADTMRVKIETDRAVVDAARGPFETVAERVADTTQRRTLARALAETLEVQQLADATAKTTAEEREARVVDSPFADAEAARAALLPAQGRAELEAAVRAYDVARETETERLRGLELDLAGVGDEPPDLDASSQQVSTAKQTWSDAVERAKGLDLAARSLRETIGRAKTALAHVAERITAHDLIAGIANALSGRNGKKMDLETFVLAAELEEIVAAANLRLDDMSSGRYLLRHTDAVSGRGAAGLGIEVIDAFTGQARPPQSLSGGETFLASLALALGLAQVVTEDAGGIRLDTLFIDEGFGSLDSETLELAMRTLDELRQGGRTVGVISHVEAMKEQLPAQLSVRSSAAGPSVIQQGSLAAT